MAEVTMPRLSDTMEEGELTQWLKQVGDPVGKGDVLALIETDKATMDLESFESGVLEKQLVAEGTVVPIGQAVAIIGDGSSIGTEPEPVVESESIAEDAPDAPESPPGEKLDSAEGEKTESKLEPAAPESTTVETSSGADKLRMSPLARKLARDNNIDVSAVKGTGPQGRIIRADIDAAVEAKGPARNTTATVTAPGAEPESDSGKGIDPGADSTSGSETVPLNRIRKVTARRLSESQAVPHFFLTNVVDVERLLALRAEVNRGLAGRGMKVSLNDFIIKAIATALRQHPDVNVSWNDDSILRHRRINVGVAVATDAGLLVPVVADADSKTLSEIGAQVVELAGKARDGTLSLDQMSGGTFSVSNLGMFGIDEFTAMINPPEAGILAVGAASPMLMLREGKPVEVSQMKITMTVDHRALDGATAAAFLRDVKGILEEPLQILV